MHIRILSMLLFVVLMSAGNAIGVERNFRRSTDDGNVSVAKTKLRVALFPYIPDSAGDNFNSLLRFIEDEFRQIRPNIDLQLRPLTVNEDYYSLTTLTSWLSSSGTGYDVVEIDTVLLGDLVNAGLIAPQFPITEIHPDWHSAAANAVQFNQAVYGFPHLLCAYFLITRNERMANVTTIDQLIETLGSNVTNRYRLIGNLNSSWELPALWVHSHQNSQQVHSNMGAFALHAGQNKSFETMRKLAQLCERVGGENNCLDGSFRDDDDETSQLFASKQTTSIFGFSERLFRILEDEDPEDYAKIQLTPLPIGTTANQPVFFTDAFVFRRNMSNAILNAAQAFVQFMGTPRMQAVVVGSGDSPNTRPRYTLPISKSAYDEPLLMNDRFYQEYFRKLGIGHSFPNTGLLNTRRELQATILKYIGVKQTTFSSSSSTVTISVNSNHSLLLPFILYLLHK